MYFYCYVYVFLLLCMFCSVYSVFIVPIGILRLPWLRFFRAFSSVVRQMPGHNSQRWGTARTLPKLIVLFYVLFVSIVLFYVLFVCICVLYYCHRVSTKFQLTNISNMKSGGLWRQIRCKLSHWIKYVSLLYCFICSFSHAVVTPADYNVE